jgi:CubicO group peptidase (beta-lactamase class C family)
VRKHRDGLSRKSIVTGSPVVQGVSHFLDAVAAAGLELHSFMLYQGGNVLAEGWWQPYRADRVHMMHSAAKSFTATGIGIAIDEGLLQLEDPVISFFPDHLPARVDPNLEAMTVRHLLTMTTGHATGISGGEWRAVRSSWIAEFFKEPVVQPPGGRFIYSSATSYMLSAIIRRVSGQRLYDYMRPRFFEPLGISDIRWDIGPDDTHTGGNGLSCTTADLLKLGIVHLSGGEWNGRRILSRRWVEEATRPQLKHVVRGAFTGKRYFADGEGQARTPGVAHEGYGFHWWMGPHGTYSARGFYGQYCIVFPREAAVFAATGGLPVTENGFSDLIWTHLLPALGGTVSGEEQPGLALRLADLALPVPHRGAPPSRMPPESFVADPNEDSIECVCLVFTDDRVIFTMVDRRGTHTIEAGLGFWIEAETTIASGRLHHGYEPQSMRVVAAASWLDAHTLSMTWVFVETAFRDTVACRFEEGRLYLDHSVNANAEDTRRPTVVAHAACGGWQ